MNTYETILKKQKDWADKRGLDLKGSQGERGRPAYTPTISDNLFKPLEQETEVNFRRGDGNEIQDSPAKMRATHSTSALVVNVFQYWKQKSPSTIAEACGFCEESDCQSEDIRFEEKFPISDIVGNPPNIDVVIHNSTNSPFRVFAIECKFTEPYSSREHEGLKTKYLEVNKLWAETPNLHSYAETISPDDNDNKYLHAAQLIKHILGLKSKFGKIGFKLQYLWYEGIGEESKTHAEEVARFKQATTKDGINFSSLTYQELFAHLSQYKIGNEEYFDYLDERYFKE